MNQNDGESCPGADTCRDEHGPGNLWKYPEENTELVCRGCRLVATKPELMPEQLVEHVNAALMLSELKNGGATFAYPDALPAVEWAAMAGLQRGRDRAENLRADRERSDKKKPVPKNRRNRQN